MKKLTNERKERLLSELLRYRYEKDNNVKALEALKQKLELIKEDIHNNGHTIAYQSERLKEENSFLNKINNRLDKKENLTYDDMHDIVGVRLVCLNLTDAYETVKRIKECFKDEILEFKDYVVEKPKESGYMGYHIIVNVPIDTPHGIQYIKSEIQIRTIFMDIFAREEHKLSYKGNATKKDKEELKALSDKLFFYDNAIDNMFKIDIIKEPSMKEEEIKKCAEEFERVSYLYEGAYNAVNNKLIETINSYKNKDDILHFTSRIKPIPSINRKLKQKKLECTAKNIVNNIRDVIGFKLVCIDNKVAKDLIKHLTEIINSYDKVKITNVSDRLDEPKETGYRGYKMNIGFTYPTMFGNVELNLEVLVRTMVMDAWALHDDKLFNTPTEETTRKQLRGLSDALHDVEEKLQDIKNNVPKNSNSDDLVKEIEVYQDSKITKKLVIKPTDDNNNKKDDEL